MSLVAAEATPGLLEQAGRKIEKFIKRNEKSIPIPNSKSKANSRQDRARHKTEQRTQLWGNNDIHAQRAEEGSGACWSNQPVDHAQHLE